MVLQHNILAMNSNRMYNLNIGRKAKQTERLSSGYKINRAADDAAGLAISEKMRRQIKGLSRATENCQDGISLVQVADGAMAEVQDMLDRCTELCIQAANGTMMDEDRGYLQLEISQIKNEIDKIKDRTTFNEIPVFKPDGGVAQPGMPTIMGGLPVWVKVNGASGMPSGQMNTSITTSAGPRRGFEMDFSALDDAATRSAKLAELASDNSGFYTTCCTCSNHYSLSFVTGAAAGVRRSGNHFIYEVSVDGVTSGAEMVNRIKNAMGSRPNGHYTSLETSGSTLKVFDNRADYDPTNGSRTPGLNNGLMGPGVAFDPADVPTTEDIVIQAGSENGHTINIERASIGCSALGIVGTDISTQGNAAASINAFKNAKQFVSSERSKMGAIQNRLEHTINNLNNVVENTTSAESQLRDTDMAETIAAFRNSDILAQAGQSILSQTNQMPEMVLSLLG